MKRTTTLGAIVFSVLMAFPVYADDAARRAPHIVFFLADDLGWSDVGYHGSEIQTPHLDQLARGGARLESFYVQPVCSPTRAALLTGRYPMRLGLQVGVIRPYAQYGLPREERTLPQALREAGYVTAICGKWHLGLHAREYLPTRRGFDHQYGHYCGALDYFTHERDGGLDWHRNDQAVREEGYTTVLIGDEAVRLIEKHDTDRPLFLYVAFNAPHSPLQALEEHLHRYRHIADGKRRAYAAMVHCLDEQVGRVVAAIDQRGMTDDTLFVFSSDNGGPINLGATNGKLRAGKGTLYEGGVRVTAFAAWKGKIPAGAAVNEPLHMVDWYPTLLKLAGASLEQKRPLDGKDLWPVITAGQPSPHEDILLNTAPTGGAVRYGDWKLIVRGDRSAVDDPSAAPRAAGAKKKRPGPRASTVELFHLADDPAEQRNLASMRQDLVRELQARLDKYARDAVPPRNAPPAPGFQAPAVWGEAG